jgi:hypothetical protein
MSLTPGCLIGVCGELISVDEIMKRHRHATLCDVFGRAVTERDHRVPLS